MRPRSYGSMLRLAATLVLVGSIPLLACGDDKGSTQEGGDDKGDSPPAVEVSVPATSEGLQNLFRGIIENLRAGNDQKVADALTALALPDPKAFFEELYKEDVAARLIGPYRERAEHLGEIADLLRAQLDLGRDRIVVERFEDPQDEKAVGFQSIALRAMKSPTPLYSVRFLADDEDSGLHLWSFAHDGKHFRWLGKQAEIREKLSDEDAKKLELRLELAKRIAPE